MATMRTALLLVSTLALGCTVKLATMAREDGRSSLACPEAKWKLRFKSAEARSYIVYGCGRWELYEGSCNGETNGCDRVGTSPDCDGGCRTRRVDQGELGPNGELPEHALHPNKKRDG